MSFFFTIDCILILAIIFASIKFLQSAGTWIFNNYKQCLDERTKLLENLRIDLAKQTIKSDYFSIMYFSITGNKQMIKMAKKQLESIRNK